MDNEIENLKNRIKEIERKKEISELKEQIAKLEGKEVNKEPHPLSHKSIEQNLSEGMKDLGSSFGELPHIMIPTPGDRKNLSDKPNIPLFNEKEKKVVRNIKKWGLIGGIAIIIGYCIYRVLKGWIF